MKQVQGVRYCTNSLIGVFLTKYALESLVRNNAVPSKTDILEIHHLHFHLQKL